MEILPCPVLCFFVQIEAQVGAADIFTHGLLLPAKPGIGQILIAFGGRTNILQNGHPAFIILSEVPDQASAATHDIQAHEVRIVLIAAERGKNIRHIPSGHGGDAVQIGLANIRRAVSKHLLDGCVFHLDAKAVQYGVSGSDHALVDAEFLCPTAAFHGLFVVDIQNVHGAVSDVCQQIRAPEVPQTVGNGRVPLGEQATSHKTDMVVLAIEAEGHLLILEKIAAEFFTLPADPGQRQSGGKVNLRFPDTGQIQFSGNCHQSQDIVVLVHGFVGNEFLVSLSDAIVHSAVLQNIAGEDRLGFIDGHAGGRDSIGGFDVAVPVVNSDDFDVVPFSHLLCTSLYLLLVIKNVPFP